MSAARARPRKVRKLDRYEIIAQLAKGGMATVYLARLRGVGGFERLLAIKMMHPHLAEETQFVNMFLDEARLAAKLHHPNAVAITDVCTTDAGHYLVMEYVDGFTLSDLIKRKDVEPQRRIRLGLRILLDAATGLDAAHRLTDNNGKGLDIVHRDVSPQNIMVSCNGVGRITDFGIALAAARITASQPGTLKGKFNYMSPEQALGAAVDRRADVFCLGIILWELLVGRKLFQDPAGGAATLTRVVTADIEPPSGLSEVIGTEFDDVCLKALMKKREDRFSSAREFVSELEKATLVAGMHVTTLELSDAINEIFLERIKERRRAIAEFLMGDEVDISLVSSSDLVSLPVILHAADDHSDNDGVHTPSRITPREPGTDSDFPTIRADSLTPKPLEEADTPPTRRYLLFGAGGVALVLALVLALGFFFMGSEEPAGDDVADEVAEPQDVAAPPSEVVLPPSEEQELAASDEASSTETDAGAVAVADEPSVEETEAAAVAARPPAGRRGTRSGGRRGQARRTGSGQRGTTSSSSSGSQGSTPTPTPAPAENELDWEDNPYLRR